MLQEILDFTDFKIIFKDNNRALDIVGNFSGENLNLTKSNLNKENIRRN